MYWTAHFDAYVGRNMPACDAPLPPPLDMRSDEPEVNCGRPGCLALKLWPLEEAGYYDVKCTAPLQYLCEGNKTEKAVKDLILV